MKVNEKPQTLLSSLGIPVTREKFQRNWGSYESR